MGQARIAAVKWAVFFFFYAYAPTFFLMYLRICVMPYLLFIP